MRANSKKRRDVMVAGLNKIKGFSCRFPHGAFYVFPNITRPDGHRRSSPTRSSMTQASLRCPARRSANFGEGYLRFSVANSIDNIEKASIASHVWTKKNL